MKRPMLKLLTLATALCLPALAMAQPLPEALTKSGEIRIAVTPNYPPLEFRDPATSKLTGFDIDLGTAIAEKIGLKAKWQETSFSEMLSALKTGRVDAIMSGMTDLATRHDSATFIDYLRSGPQFFIMASRAAEIPDAEALCGKKVGASRRTSFPTEIKKWSDAHCGQKPIEFVGTEGSADARTQLKQGRIDAAMQGSETLPYIMGQEPGAFKPIGKPIAFQFTGLAVPVAETGLQKAIVGALDGMIASGEYKKILDKWQLGDEGVEKAEINAGK